ncbi:MULTISPECIES: AAA family ATPase [Vibrio harveyi group]|uniref:AAA family ATPase n=1 Tax=Vibrio harveyi group TaxID=717610 RepID=UPI000C28D115|nr:MULTISPECIES: ATP-binding protein [Vibrio harveyi group]AWG77378.1 AAA family ATPase [Vibrio parahaemolyticus]AWJ77006.1 AAA family ATPase [Vibrio parahaemolyticus]MCS0346099.1 ATP-binding protein [Vibrio diabolicus]MCS0358861.1 ATP-binding protein [Vibrio diabolicus]MCS0374557.1 ATP-binding protein [Vibrio diabolicus]
MTNVRGKLLIGLIESALNSDQEQARVIANILSNDLREQDPNLSNLISKLTKGKALRGVYSPNPHYKNKNSMSTDDLPVASTLFLERAETNLSGEPLWSNEIHEALSQVCLEHSCRNKLLKHDLHPTRSLVFTGPPGVGKTMSAGWLANKLNLPLKTLNLATVMSSYLGKSGSNLHDVFSEAASEPCVLLLDEFDAIAKKRGDDSDIGELKRLVTVLLQLLDQWPSSSLLIAATNHPELVDPAIWRRFEEKIEFKLPTVELIECYLESFCGSGKFSSLAPFFEGRSFAEIQMTLKKIKKNSIIKDTDFFEELTVICASDRLIDEMSANDKKSLAIKLVNANLSQRKVANLLKISRPTIKKALEGLDN